MANSKARRKQALARARRKRIIIRSAVGLVALALAVLVTLYVIQRVGTETYSDGTQIVKLSSDGTFTASLYHGSYYSGTYAKSSRDGVTTVAFTSGGVTYEGEIDGKILHIPHEWEDDHGHGGVMAKQ